MEEKLLPMINGFILTLFSIICPKHGTTAAAQLSRWENWTPTRWQLFWSSSRAPLKWNAVRAKVRKGMFTAPNDRGSRLSQQCQAAEAQQDSKISTGTFLIIAKYLCVTRRAAVQCIKRNLYQKHFNSGNEEFRAENSVASGSNYLVQIPNQMCFVAWAICISWDHH